MKNYRTKSEILLDQKLITQAIMMKNIYKKSISNDDLFFKKTLELHDAVIVVRSDFNKGNKCYP